MRLLIMVLWPLGSSVAPFSIYICRGATKRHQQTSPRTRPRASRIAHFFLVSGALSASMSASFVPVPVCCVLRPAADELRPPSLARNTSAPPYSHAARRPAFFLAPPPRAPLPGGCFLVPSFALLSRRKRLQPTSCCSSTHPLPGARRRFLFHVVRRPLAHSLDAHALVKRKTCR